MPKHWTLREDEDPNIIHHQGLIGAGGYGEVHQVPLLRIAIPNHSFSILKPMRYWG
jgi:hypothetical protein